MKDRIAENYLTEHIGTWLYCCWGSFCETLAISTLLITQQFVTL